MKRIAMEFETQRSNPLPALCAVALLMMLLGSGCATGGAGGGSAGNSGVDQLHLFAVPVAVDIDQLPGPDGVAVRVYASSGERAKGVTIKKGLLEILMYDGAMTEINPANQTPLRTWSFQPEQLKAGSGSSSLGVGYRFVLPWEQNVPTLGRVTVLARYTAPKGRPIYSSPSGISVTAK